MEEFYPSEVARLVLGYLKKQESTASWQTFLDESVDLQEHKRLLKEGKIYTTNVNGKSLLDILSEYCVLKSRKEASLLETFSNDFSTFYANKRDTDCVLKVSHSQFHVHRAVLSARSSVFSAMFHHDTAERRSGVVNIPDIKASVLGDILYYIYSGKIRGLTANTATSMFTAADKYDLPALQRECFEFIKCNLTLDNFCEVALLAHMHGEMELEERVVLFIEKNSKEVFESNIWHQFLKDKTLIASRLMSRLKISKNEQFRDTTSK